MKYYLLAILSLVVFTLTSCDDTTDTIGKSVVPTTDSLYTTATEYPLTTNSILADDVIARSRYGYVGCIKDPETNSYVKTNFMTQLHLLSTTKFPNIDTLFVAGHYEDKVKDLTDAERLEKCQNVEADSCKLILYYDKFYGDSLANMKLVAHELSTPYEESETYYIDFDPTEEDMLRNGEGTIHEPVTYTLANTHYAATSTARHSIEIPLNKPYTDKDGNTYSNYGTYLMRQYYNTDAAHHSGYNSPYAFIHELCPGFYFENVGGIGSMAYISGGALYIYYRSRYSVNDTLKTKYEPTTIGATEEVMQMTNITQNKATLENLASNDAHTYIKCPAGIFTSVTLPIDDIMQGHEEDTLSTARIFLPVLNNPYSGSSFEYANYALERPQKLLLVSTDSVNSFFANNEVCDYRNNFLATYATSDKSNGYTFSNISSLITKMYNAKKASGLSDEQYEAAHPNWNKVQLIPVETSTSTSSSSTTSSLTKVTNRMTIGSTMLAKGTGLADSPVKVSVIYSKFNKD